MPAKKLPIRKPVPGQKNEKGEFVSLIAASTDGQDLKSYVKNGSILGEMTPAQIRKKFPQFNCYEYGTFAGALRRARISQGKQVQDRHDQQKGCK